jgi:hypothetical protein
MVGPSCRRRSAFEFESRVDSRVATFKIWTQKSWWAVLRRRFKQCGTADSESATAFGWVHVVSPGGKLRTNVSDPSGPTSPTGFLPRPRRAIDVSVALPQSFESAQHFATAEKLGYRGAYLYDTPFEGDDVWLSLHRAAELTTTIELGPGVLIPTQRHPLVNAAQTVSLHRLAPGRVVTAFGTGFSSRAATGHQPICWSYMEAYIRVYQGLLAGEVVD